MRVIIGQFLPRFAAWVQTWINYHGNCQTGHTVRISRFLAYPVQPSLESSALYASLVRIWTCKEGMSFCVMPSQATECPVCPVWFAALVFPQSETRAPRMPQNRPQETRVFPMNVSLFIGPFFREKNAQLCVKSSKSVKKGDYRNLCPVFWNLPQDYTGPLFSRSGRGT